MDFTLTEQDLETVAMALYYARLAHHGITSIDIHWSDLAEETRIFYRAMAKASFASMLSIVLERAQNGEQRPFIVTSEQANWGEII